MADDQGQFAAPLINIPILVIGSAIVFLFFSGKKTVTLRPNIIGIIVYHNPDDIGFYSPGPELKLSQVSSVNINVTGQTFQATDLGHIIDAINHLPAHTTYLLFLDSEPRYIAINQ